MRGHLRIRADRAPYRRAGLCFGEERQLEVPIGELDGERLFTLLSDQALRVDAWHDGRYQPLGELAPADTARDLQLLIDFFGREGGEEGDVLGAAAPRAAGDEDGRLTLLATQLGETREALSRANVENANLRGEVTRLMGRASDLETAVRAGESRVQELSSEISDKVATIGNLTTRAETAEARVGELQAAAAKAPPSKRAKPAS